MNRLALAALLSLATAGLARAEAVSTLIAEKATEEMGSAMPEAGNFDITMQTTDPTQAELVSAFWMDQATGQFIANVLTPEGQTWRVSGVAVLTVPVPVPTHRIMPDAILRADDFRSVSLPYARVNSFAITDMKRLVGMQVRRVLGADRPVMAQSISPPLVIDRGSRVTIEYSKGRMSLSAPGKALDNAEADQPVRVMNLASNRTVTGIARTDGVVEVAQ
ncbi:flagellar basal body P-ring formation protein FlgA [Thioclava sp. BHET1]|nr:flagellar basal body P-ring formation protein FlgA [Thioclava sp. BHET1]